MKTFHLLTLFLFTVLVPFDGHSQQAGAPDRGIVESSLLPAPQQVSFPGKTFALDQDWSIAVGTGIPADDPAVADLVTLLKNRFGIAEPLKRSGEKKKGAKVIRLTVKPGSVRIGEVPQENKAAILEQAYRLSLSPTVISLEANAPAGLFYGVQTFLQIVASQREEVALPAGDITDWPDLGLRIIYWDCAHHLDRMENMKRAIRQAAYYKINGLALKLEGHFEFKSAKPIIEPYAYSPGEFQELTDYALKYYVQLIPYLDAPAHVSFILKHPEYAHLRAYPESNYEFSVVNPETQKLLTAMFDDLMNANKGGKYFLLSTDEAYYVGKPENEKDTAAALGGNGRLLASFTTAMSNYLHDRKRDVIIWAEYPLKVSDIDALPSHLINGVYNGRWASKLKEHGIRQLIYTSAQGVEPLFPNYYPVAAKPVNRAGLAKTDDEIAQGDLEKGRVAGLLKSISEAIGNHNADLIGTVVAAWGDAGLHPETFWLGYTTGTAAAWNYEPASAHDLSARFYNSFYGPGATKMERVYQLLSNQAKFYGDSWEWVPSDLRSPILGNSNGMFDAPKKVKDQTLPVLPVPSAGDLSLSGDWAAANAERLGLATDALQQNSELIELLHANLREVHHQRENLDVLLSVANLCRQNIRMILGLQRMNTLLKLSSAGASRTPEVAVSLIDQALDEAEAIRNARNETFQNVVSTWYQAWFPRVAEANGRRFLDAVDNIKDHVPVRTVDMTYLIYRELNYPLGKWAEETMAARNQFARAHKLPERAGAFNWEDTGL
jgi:hypothetical protein